LWAINDWKSRRRFVFGFALMMAVLLAASEFVLPGWWRMFIEALRQYHQYTQNLSVLDQLINWLLGPLGGTALAAIAVLLSAMALWKMRHGNPGAEEFAASIALVLALTVLIVPMVAPYNQVLLLPAILWLVRHRRAFGSASRVTRIAYAFGALSVLWQWVACLVLAAEWCLWRPQALTGWKLPLYANFALPLLMFALTFILAARKNQWPVSSGQ
jgi:hypothetical protein